MFKYFLKRLAQMVVTLFIVSILVFVLANFIGDPVNMLVSPKAPPEVREQVREELGLNRPILEQYVSFITNAFKGDFGKSYIYKVDALSLIASGCLLRWSWFLYPLCWRSVSLSHWAYMRALSPNENPAHW